MTKGNRRNLIPASERTKEEAMENGRKGGLKSGEARRKKRAVRNYLEIILSLKISNQDITEELTKAILFCPCRARYDIANVGRQLSASWA